MSAGVERIPEAGPESGGPESSGPESSRPESSRPESSRPEPAPLSWRDAVRLRMTAEPALPGPLLRNAKWLAFAAGLVLCVLFLVAVPVVPCTAAAPCGPDRVGNIVIGLLVSAPLLGLVRLSFAAIATAAMVVCALGYELTQTEHLAPWFYLLLVAYAAGCGVLARLTGMRRRHRSALRQWHERAERVLPTTPPVPEGNAPWSPWPPPAGPWSACPCC